MTDHRPTIEEERRWNKLGAPLEMDFLVKVREKSVDQVMSMGRWLLASLLVINGGGALATLNSASTLNHPGLPGFLFVAGIMFALLNGWAIQAAGLKQLAPINEVIGYWLSVADDGERVEEMEVKHKKIGRRMKVQGQFSAIPGWISALLFLGGAIALAQSVPSS